METYENAPATKLVASHCAICGKPLVDANSVEAGMGPECRRIYGRPNPQGDKARNHANVLIYRIAALQDGSEEVLTALAQLFALGFENVADRISKRLVKISITAQGDRYVVKTPYNEDANDRFRRVPGRRWDADSKVNTFPKSSRVALWEALRACFQGMPARTDNNKYFTIL